MEFNGRNYRREDMLPVSKIRKLIPGRDGGPCSFQHVLNLIDRGDLKPAFRFGCTCVPRQVVEEYIEHCRIDPAA